MSEISNVLVYALKIKYNYILSLYFKTCTKGLRGGGGSLVDKAEGRGRSDNTEVLSSKCSRMAHS